MPQPNVEAELRKPSARPPGATDPETGEFTPGAAPPAYATLPGFYLDEGPELTAGRDGQVPLVEADGQFFPSDRNAVGKYDIAGGDAIRMTYRDGKVVEGRVVRAVRATGIVYLESV